MTETSYSSYTKKSTAKKVNYGISADANEFKITKGNCLVNITSVSGTYGEITITYVLENDREETASIRPYYSEDGGSSYNECTKGTGGDAKTSLSTSAGGTSHTFVWNSYTDLGNGFVGDVLVKIRAYDKNNRVGDYLESQQKKISISNAPTAPTLISPSSGYFLKDSTPRFTFTIPADRNPTNTYSRIHFKIEVDVAEDFDSEKLQIFESNLDTTGWQYKNEADAWTGVPIEGLLMNADLVGNYVRFSPQTEDRLERTTLYWRAVIGEVEGSAIKRVNVGVIKLITGSQ